MKAILEFNLPEDDEKFKDCIKASDYHSVLWDFANDVLRKYRKYEALTDEQSRIVEKITDEFYELIRDYNIEL